MRSVERTLAVLRALNASRTRSSSISELERQTRISRPALYRIIASLVEQGYVYRGPTDDTFELTHLVRLLSCGFREEFWVTQIASPVITRLQEKVVWPVDICTFADNAMVMRETTRSGSPLSIDIMAGGLRFPMHSTAVGRAYLAFCGEAERQVILQNLKAAHDVAGDAAGAPALDEAALGESIRKAQAKGYGERYREMFGATGTIAIPVVIEGKVFCCLSLAFIASVLTPDQAAARYLDDMKAAAAEIAAGYLAQRDSFVVPAQGSLPR